MIEVAYKDFTYYEYQGKDHDLKDLLETEFKVQDEYVEDVFSSTQLSKVEERKDYLYFALQFPAYHQEFEYIQIKQIHCFVSPKYLLVVDENSYQGMEDFDNARDDLVEKE